MHPPPWLLQLLKDNVGVDVVIDHLLIMHLVVPLLLHKHSILCKSFRHSSYYEHFLTSHFLNVHICYLPNLIAVITPYYHCWHIDTKFSKKICFNVCKYISSQSLLLKFGFEIHLTSWFINFN
jgi:hypothetical protein